MKSIKVENHHRPMGHADLKLPWPVSKNNHRLSESEIRTGFVPLRAGSSSAESPCGSQV